MRTQYQPGHADGVEESVVTQHVNQLRRRSGSSHDAEHGQQGVPYDQRAAQLKSAMNSERKLYQYSGKVPRLGDQSRASKFPLVFFLRHDLTFSSN